LAHAPTTPPMRLLQATPAQLVAAQHRLIDEGMQSRLGAFPIGPVVGDAACRWIPSRRCDGGRAQRVPLIVGTNADEGRCSLASCECCRRTKAMIEELARRHGTGYPRTQLPPPTRATRRRRHAFSLAATSPSARPPGRSPRPTAATRPPYLYRYDYAPRALRWSGLGATHATELLAVFDFYRTRSARC